MKGRDFGLLALLFVGALMCTLGVLDRRAEISIPGAILIAAATIAWRLPGPRGS